MVKDPGNTFRSARKIRDINRPRPFRGFVSDLDRRDFYQFQLSRSSKFQLTLKGLTANANVVLFKDRQRISQSRQPKKKREGISVDLEAGTYYIKVFAKDKTKIKYKLKLFATAIESLEPNPNVPSPSPTPSGPTSSTQTFTQTWIKQLGTADEDEGYSIAVGPNQEIYVGGTTKGALEGSNFGGLDAFISQYDSSGNQQWISQRGTPFADEFSQILIHQTGDIYATGAFSDGLTSSWLGYSSAGNLLFETTLDAIDLIYLVGVRDTALGKDGSLYFTGISTSLLDIVDGDNEVDGNAFIAKYDSNQDLRYQRLIELPQDGYATGITVDSNGNSYITGITNGVPAPIGDPNRINGDAFLAKYDSNGNELWFKTLSSSESDFPRAIALDDSGNIYFTGNTSGSLAGGSNQGSSDIFLAKYTTDGAFQWLKQFGSPETDMSESIAIDASGKIYIAGESGGSLFGNSPVGKLDAWVAQFNSDGNVLDSLQFGTEQDDGVYGMTVDSQGSLYLTGKTAGNLGGINQGGMDVWLAKYSISS